MRANSGFTRTIVPSSRARHRPTWANRKISWESLSLDRSSRLSASSRSSRRRRIAAASPRGTRVGCRESVKVPFRWKWRHMILERRDGRLYWTKGLPRWGWGGTSAAIRDQVSLDDRFTLDRVAGAADQRDRAADLEGARERAEVLRETLIALPGQDDGLGPIVG